MKLIIRLRKDAAPAHTAFLMCAVLLDFMAYIWYVLSKQFHNSETKVDLAIIVFVFGKKLAGLLISWIMLSSQTYHYWS